MSAGPFVVLDDTNRQPFGSVQAVPGRHPAPRNNVAVIKGILRPSKCDPSYYRVMRKIYGSRQERDRANYQRNREKIIERRREFRRENADAINSKRRAEYRADPEKQTRCGHRICDAALVVRLNNTPRCGRRRTASAPSAIANCCAIRRAIGVLASITATLRA